MGDLKRMALLRTAVVVITCGLVHSASFDVGKATTFAGWSAAAYCDNLQNWDCGAQCRRNPHNRLVNITVVQDNNTQGQAFVGFDRASATIVVSFRGTVLLDFDNWWSDLSSLQLVQSPLCPIEGCQVGAGFLRAYHALREGVFEGLNSLREAFPKAPVVLTGHSLGASLAHLCVLDCHQQGIAVQDEITFGSPRSGNYQFSKYFRTIKGGRWRITHDQDPIPHLPPWNTPLDFWHITTEVYFPNRTGFEHQICTEGEGEDKNCCMGAVPLPSPLDHVHYLGWGLGTQFCVP